MGLLLERLCLLIGCRTVLAILLRGTVRTEPCSGKLLLGAEGGHLCHLCGGGRTGGFVQVLSQMDAVRTGVGSEVVVGAAAILTRDALDDIDRFNTSHSVFLKAPRIIFSCTICIPLRTVIRFILHGFAFGIRFRLSGCCVTFGAFSLPLILLNCSSMPPHREVSENLELLSASLVAPGAFLIASAKVRCELWCLQIFREKK